jgi:flagellar motor switch protein FliG
MSMPGRSVRKAAILLVSLETRHAEELLAQMPPEQAQALRAAVEHLGPVAAREQDEVIEEFFRIGPLVPEEDTAGVELNEPLPAPWTQRVSPDSPLACAGRAAAPFQSLGEVPPARLGPYLAREGPQTVAVVIAHLPPDRAAEILAHLPSELQTEAARRLVELHAADPEVLAEVERGLESWLRGQVQRETRTAAGIEALASILDAANPAARHQILANLARDDRELAEQLEPPVAAPAAAFADLERLDPPALAAVFEAADGLVATLALAGAPPRFAERALAILGPRRAELERAMCNLGPTPLADIEQAQQQLAELAARLEAQGKICVPPRGRLSVAV